MKADFTRDTFDVTQQFTRVLTQQGRVTVDADFNEQAEILLHYLRALARDLIGPYAAPADDPGFILKATNDGLLISAGRYYVDGILVENDTIRAYNEQPYYPLLDDDPLKDLTHLPEDEIFWLYLDVWERHVTSLDDDLIRETALGGPDTATRTQVVWQVKALRVEREESSYGRSYFDKITGERSRAETISALRKRGLSDEEINRLLREQKLGALPVAVYGGYGEELDCHAPLAQLVGLSRVQLAAQVDPGEKSHNACVTPPASKYRGVENHLYRVEIHHGGDASEATFKWSRDNASVVTTWQGTAGNDLQVANVRGFSAGNWVELSDDRLEYQGREGLLVKVAKVQDGNLSIDPASAPQGLLDYSTLKNPKVRRWDQVEKGDIRLRKGAVPVVETLVTENADKAKWINLEDGIQVAFSQLEMSTDGQYRTGDYWLIPARVASGNIEWPAAKLTGKMSLRKPRGVDHHYAPLGFMGMSNGRQRIERCYCEFEPLGDCFRLKSRATGAHLLNEWTPATVPSDEAREIAKEILGGEAAPSATKTTRRRAPAKKKQK